jgi:CDP-diacylglycerol--glycerol-3-phosphate 3-phosphatidyltransferase
LAASDIGRDPDSPPAPLASRAKVLSLAAMKALPNLITGLRLALALVVFFALAAASGDAPWPKPGIDLSFELDVGAFVAFVVAAASDFFDGWLARRWRATSVWGAILDPIADKVLVCATVLGLIASVESGPIVIPAGLILFREFTVSALREVTAGRGVSLPVTLLAKWKTTLQLVALGAELVLAALTNLLPPDDSLWRGPIPIVVHALLWLATAVTLITGAQYLWQARKALAAG